MINLISIQPNKDISQTHNAKVLPKKPKTIYLNRTIEREP